MTVNQFTASLTPLPFIVGSVKLHYAIFLRTLSYFYDVAMVRTGLIEDMIPVRVNGFEKFRFN